MASSSEIIRQSIKKLMVNEIKPNFFMVSVSSVDTTNNTCSGTIVSGQDNANIQDIHLSTMQNDGFICVPGITSTILVIKNTADNKYYMISSENLQQIIVNVNGDHDINTTGNINHTATQNHDLTGDIVNISGNTQVNINSPKIVYNNGSNGGLVLVNNLVTKLNAIENYLDALLICIQGITPAGSETGLAAFKLAVAAVSADIYNIIPTIASNIESTVITQ